MPYSYKPLMFFGALIVIVELIGIPNDWKAKILITVGVLMVIFAFLYKFYNRAMGYSKVEYSDKNETPITKPVLQSVDDNKNSIRKYNRLVS